MSTDRDPRWRPPTRRTALIALANALPLVGYLTGSVTVLEVLAVYVLETLFVGGAVGAKLLVVDPAASDRRAPTLVRIDREWLPRPIRITYWNVDQSLFAMVVYAAVTTFLLGAGAMFLGTVLAFDGVDPRGGFSFGTIALTSLGLALVHAREVGAFLVSDAPHRVSATQLKA